MRIVLFGSPEFALPSLESLVAAKHEIVGVVSQPPRPAGRRLRARRTPVAECAVRAGLALHEPARLKDFERVLETLRPELLVVVAYGRILKRAVLEAAPRGALNVHASLLPRWRGASPVAHAILAGDPVTGVSIMQLDEGMDTGPVYAMREEAIRPDDTTGELERRLALLGAELLVETLEGISRGRAHPRPQSEGPVALAPRIRSEQGRIDWTQPAEHTARLVRAMNPWPIAFTTLKGKRLRIHAARVARDQIDAPLDAAADKGRVLAPSRDGFTVSCGSGSLVVLAAQIEGRATCAARDLVNGRVVGPGDRLGT